MDQRTSCRKQTKLAEQVKLSGTQPFLFLFCNIFEIYTYHVVQVVVGKTLANLVKRTSFASILPSQIPDPLNQLKVKCLNLPTFSSVELWNDWFAKVFFCHCFVLYGSYTCIKLKLVNMWSIMSGQSCGSFWDDRCCMAELYLGCSILKTVSQLHFTVWYGWSFGKQIFTMKTNHL